MGQAKINRALDVDDPSKIVTLAMVMTDWTNYPSGPVGSSTFHMDVDVGAIERIAGHFKSYSKGDLVQGLGEGLIEDMPSKSGQEFAQILCAYFGQTETFQKLKAHMALGASACWLKAIINRNRKSNTLIRPTLVAHRDVVLDLLETVREKGPLGLDDGFMDLVGSPKEPEMMNYYDPSIAARFEPIVTDDGRVADGNHRSMRLTGRWYKKH